MYVFIIPYLPTLVKSSYKPPLLSIPGVLIGVPNTVLGVCAVWCFGVTPLKSDWRSGVLSPPFKGVSTSDNAIIFCAS
jgi:hypothetical protein